MSDAKHCCRFAIISHNNLGSNDSYLCPEDEKIEAEKLRNLLKITQQMVVILVIYAVHNQICLSFHFLDTVNILSFFFLKANALYDMLWPKKCEQRWHMSPRGESSKSPCSIHYVQMSPSADTPADGDVISLVTVTAWNSPLMGVLKTSKTQLYCFKALKCVVF